MTTKASRVRAYWEPGPDGKIRPLRLLWFGVLAAAVSWALLHWGGTALKAYDGLRGAQPSLTTAGWDELLPRFSLFGALTIGALTVAWRLIHRQDGQPRWGTALALVAIVLFSMFIWPTPWTYRELGCTVYHVSRFSGHHEPVGTIPGCELTPTTAAHAAGAN